ncbi:MAG: hypothetical protein L6R41_003256 [Letrouitia leprolyta]|nr:MAG: hypothetical protein L6R41_003256 [Letrouitia leprolyta]
MLFLYVISLTAALTTPIDDGKYQSIQPVTQPIVRTFDTKDNDIDLKLPFPLTAVRPQTPYLWLVREVQNQFIKFTHYGKELPNNDAYQFMYALHSYALEISRLVSQFLISHLMIYSREQFQHDINYLIRSKGKNVKMPSHQTVSSQRFTLYLTMKDANPLAAQILTWVHGIAGFMNHYDYVEADMQFLTWVSGKGDRLDGRATFVALAQDQA